MEWVIIEMNECFFVGIFSEALGSEAVLFGDFWWCIERGSVGTRDGEDCLCLFISLSTQSRINLLHYTTLLDTIHSPGKKEKEKQEIKKHCKSKRDLPVCMPHRCWVSYMHSN